MAHIRRYNPGWCTHIPVLVKILEMSEGPVLELGIGVFSTPLLHQLCYNQRRLLVSYESDKNYFDMHGNFVSPLHTIGFVENWDDIRIEETPWGMVFVDHIEERRKVEAARVANIARFVVIHDSDPSQDKHYHYSDIYPLFKYRFDYIKSIPNTTVLSNFVDVNKLEI